MRRKKTAHELKLLGSYRADRHGNRGNMPASSGEPQCPADLTGDARDYWHSVVPELVRLGIVSTLDVGAIVATCRAWSAYQQVAAQFQEQPTDKNVRIAFTSLQTLYLQSAAKIGLTPFDRGRLQVPEPEVPPVGVMGFARKRG